MSWLGLSRPSRCYLLPRREDVDARDERGHDRGRASAVTGLLLEPDLQRYGRPRRAVHGSRIEIRQPAAVCALDAVEQ